MVDTITLREVLAIMRSHQKFDIEVCTVDGDRSIYTGAMLSGAPAGDASAGPSDVPAGAVRNPMHAAHGTVNIRQANGEMRKIYPVLIERFNKKTMII